MREERQDVRKNHHVKTSPTKAVAVVHVHANIRKRVRDMYRDIYFIDINVNHANCK